MAEYLTFEQATTVPPATPAAPAGGEYLSFEQATGAPMPVTPTSFWDKVKGAYGAITEPRLTESNSSVFERGQTMTPPTFNEMYGKEARDRRALLDEKLAGVVVPPVTPRPSILESTALAAAGTLPQLSDMLTGGVKSALSLWPYTIGVKLEEGRGTPPAEAARRSKAMLDKIMPPEIFTPWATIAKNLGGDVQQAYEQNPVAWVMGSIGKIVEKGIEGASADTGIPAEHLAQIADTFMGIVGTKAFKPGVVKAFNTRISEFAGVPEAKGVGGFGPAASEVTLSPEAAIAGSQQRIAEAKAVKDLLESITKEVDTTEVPPAAPTEAELKAQEKSWNEIVVDKAKLDSIFGLAKKKGPEAEAALVNQLFTRVLRGETVKQRLPIPDAPLVEGYAGPRGAALEGGVAPAESATPTRMIPALQEWETPAGLTRQLPPVSEEMMAAHTPPRVPGNQRPALFGPGEASAHITSALGNLRVGTLLSAREAAAVQELRFDPVTHSIVNPEGIPVFQRGKADPALLKVLGLMGVGAVAGTAIYNWFQTSGGLSEDNARDVGTGLGALGAAGVIKGKGGMWHPETVARLAMHLVNSLTQHDNFGVPDWALRNPGDPIPPAESWAQNAVTTYLNRHAGTVTDPIKDLKLPDGTKWEDLTDAALQGKEATDYINPPPNAKPGELVWSARQGGYSEGLAGRQAVNTITTYLEHVGDYLKSLNLAPEKLQQYDLPRAIRETVANDTRIQKLAMEEYTKPNPLRIADTATMTPYKVYDTVQEPARTFTFKNDKSTTNMETMSAPLKAEPIQYSWQEIKLQDQLTPEQAGRVRRIEPEDYPGVADQKAVKAGFGQKYVALNAKGKPIVENFGKTLAGGDTPQQAHLAGQLAQEGNALGHCVGGYADQVIRGNSRIISLRDQHGRSYATVELNKVDPADRYRGSSIGPAETIAQIKGPGNGGAANYVQPYIQDFLNSGKWGQVADAELHGLILDKYSGKYVTAADMLKQWETELSPKAKETGFVQERMDMLRKGEVGRAGFDWTDQLEYAKKNMGGKARPEVLAGIAGGAALVAYAMSDQPKDPLTMAAMGMAGTVSLGKSRFAVMKEPELLKAFQEGTGRSKELAAAQIYENTHRSLTKAVQGWGKDLPVEDIVQQTYEKAFSALKKGQFRGESQLSTWLYGIAKNEMRDIYGSKAEKAARREVQPSLDEDTGAQVYPEKAMMEQNPEAYRSAQDVASGNQMAVQMQRALDKLPENYRRIFNAVELEGLPYEEAAVQLNIPIGTVRSGLARAKEQLQGSLREYRDLQSGKADPALLAKLGLVAGGAATGAAMNPDSQIGGSLAGAAGGFGLAALFHLSPAKAAAAIVDAFKPDTRIRINQFADAHDAGMVTAERAIWQQQRAVMQEASKPVYLAAITHAIQQNNVGSLPPALQSAANRAKTFFAEMGEQAKKAGLIKDLIDDYVTNLWDLTGKNKDAWDGILNRAGGPSMSPETRFALKRSIANLEVGKRLGLVPLTEDVAQIMGIYGKSLARSMENAKMIKSLKDSIDPASGLKLLMPSEKAPPAYVVIDSPQLSGMRVHPDIAPSLRFIFDRANSGVIAQGFQALNTAIKRSAVMGSLFHAKALLDGFTGVIDLNKKLVAGGAAAGAIYGVSTGDNPIADALIGTGAAMMAPGVKLIGQAALPRAFGENIYLKQLREGQAGDLVGTLLNSGLKISFEKGPLAVEDVSGSFYKGMTALQQGLDKVIPGAGLPVKGLTMLNHAVDTFMWERLHSAMKLTAAAQKLEQLIQANAKANAADPRVALLSKEQLAVQASSFTNDIFGGLDWRRIAEATESKFGRDVALQVYSPAGRRAAQLMMFAPDWTVSTTRAATQAFSPSLADLNPKKLLQTFLEPQNAVGLHRQYMVRSALYYATIANGINYAMSGHYIWDNKDWTTIDMGDGRTMQWSKHMMEPVHWVTKPLQQVANKLGYFPKEVINQITGKEYISTSGKAPPMDTSALGRAAHIGKTMMPISAQGAFGAKASSGGALSSMLGVPIYGKTYEERAAAKQALKDLHKTPEYKQLAAERKAAKKEAAR